ncbi:MAG: DUF481 domain-containing protein [Aquabacterium sp.]
MTWIPLCLLVCTWSAQADTRGWLKFADGNVLSGHLLRSDEAGGVFRSDRFGELSFREPEARFEAESTQPVATVLETPSRKLAEPGWRPVSWSVSLSGYWESEDGSTETDASIDLDAIWKWSGNELNLTASADYKIVDHEVDNNEQFLRARWFHDLRGPWFTLLQTQARRNTFEYDPLPPLDYLLLQNSVGLGVRKAWSEHRQTRLAIAHDRIRLELLRFDGRVRTYATSLLFENDMAITDRLTFSNITYFYFWQDGDKGVDSQSEIRQAINDKLSIGIRHELRRNAVNLDVGVYKRVSLTTRLAF